MGTGLPGLDAAEQDRDSRWCAALAALDEILGDLAKRNGEQRDLLELVEAHLVRVAWAQAGFNQSRAARLLGVPRKRVERRLRKYLVPGARLRSEEG